MNSIISKQTESGAAAQQWRDNDGNDIVKIKNVHVVIYKTGKNWIAQGIEVDYVAQGADIDTVKKRFEDGLEATINQYVTIEGDINDLLCPAPLEVRAEVLSRVLDAPDDANRVATYSQVSYHDSPIAIKFTLASAA